MRVDGSQGRKPNYFPNAFDGIEIDESYKQLPPKVVDAEADWFDRNAPGEDDHYTQPRNLFRIMDDQAQKNLISNIVGAMSGIDGPKKDEIINRQLCHWFGADTTLGAGVASGLGVEVDESMFAR